MSTRVPGSQSWCALFSIIIVDQINHQKKRVNGKYVVGLLVCVKERLTLADWSLGFHRITRALCAISSIQLVNIPVLFFVSARK